MLHLSLMHSLAAHLIQCRHRLHALRKCAQGMSATDRYSSSTPQLQQLCCMHVSCSCETINWMLHWCSTSC